MARTRSSITTGTTENNIYFYPAGGHSHDGRNSSLIDTTKYSVYDFNFGYISDNPVRRQFQINSFESLKQVIRDTVTDSILSPAGIVLQPNTLNGATIIARTIEAGQIVANTLTANEIAANTITADELVSNIVLVNNVIRSNIYTSGSAGWIIRNNGSAEFNDVTVRGTVFANSGSFTGTITSNSGTIGGWTINPANITGGSTILYSNGTGVFGNTTIQANGRITNGNFTVSATGVMTATGANFSGTITGTTTSVADVYIRENTGGNYFLTYLLGDYVQVKRTQSDYSTITGSGAFLGYYNASTGADETYLVLNTLSPWPAAGGAYAYIKNDGTIVTTGTINAATVAVSGNISGLRYNGHTIESSGFNGGIVLRYGGDARVDSNYFVGYGTVTVAAGNSTNLRRRNSDGYFLIEGSRREYKQDIEYVDYENCRNILLSLKPVKFNWKEEFNGPQHSNPLMHQINMQNKEYGFIVQEVEDSSPELVTYLDDNDEKIPKPMMWQQNGVISILVKTVQELVLKIEKIESKMV